MMTLAAVTLFVSACEPNVLRLDVGTCFDDPSNIEGGVKDVPIVDCAEPHDNEVYANRELTGDEFPGLEGIEELSGEVCLEAFADYVGIAYEESVYDIGWLNPTSETWALGDREVICFGYEMQLQKISGSIRGRAE
jgi:hypothetical protein